jgi:hypothetical protein
MSIRIASQTVSNSLQVRLETPQHQRGKLVRGGNIRVKAIMSEDAAAREARVAALVADLAKAPES